jgi:hypothetical protein
MEILPNISEIRYVYIPQEICIALGLLYTSHVVVAVSDEPSGFLTTENDTIRITAFLDFVHRPKFCIIIKQNVSETASVSIFR